jgi:hypothetical protein
MIHGPYVHVAEALIWSTLDCPCPYRREETWVWERCPSCDSLWFLAEAAFHWIPQPACQREGAR